MLRVFTKNGCGTCKSVKYQLDSKGVKYDEIDVSTPEGLDLAQKLNIGHAGTIINEKDEIVPLEVALQS